MAYQRGSLAPLVSQVSFKSKYDSTRPNGRTGLPKASIPQNDPASKQLAQTSGLRPRPPSSLTDLPSKAAQNFTDNWLM
jgi:hypothetical protein